ncbi:MetQ/NlpA family ABC transporter substrate-binding protein [Sporolactobacillus spathodeae]|uniref:D-methionine transport system substrate-binding protein n=1 Tax=Sporolactobacillus spathodeae TaxID=1465502 RepID=A0ABS2QBV3_9BACL|nr:MetQ/NlpA family ABC transporter substrate-binding protein [Sporolactobacillus spathodeae]MBM7658905.1 D-methionine transport system substrate-binding protein [Sporolactobacillus spathodeae]
MKKRAIGFISLVLIFILAIGTACSNPSASDSSSTSKTKKTITVGFNAGPYEQMFKEGIAPILKKKGYTVKTKDFTDGIQVNVAVAKGQIDANIMQHPVYMAFVNQQEGIHNVGIVQIPGPPMGVYAGKSKSLKAVKDGDVIALPNEASNLYRGLVILKDLGWIKLNPKANPANASLKDVTSNPHHLVLKDMNNAQEVRALPDVNYGVIQGNFAVSSGLKLTSALKLENLLDKFSVNVAVADTNKSAPWAKAIVEAYHSKQFLHYIKTHKQYDGYHLPNDLNQ